MAKIANVAATDTFGTWRTRSNQAFDRLSQFAINNSSLYANTLTANVAFTSKGLGTFQQSVAVTKNVTVSGNTSIVGLIANGSLGSNGLALKTNGTSVYWGQVSSNQNTYERSIFTATSGQTTFSLSYTVGFVEVYQNGIKLVSGTDFTASNGTTVVLTTGATLNDDIEIIAYNTFSVANTVTQSVLNSSLALKSNVASPTTTGRLSHTGFASVTNLKVAGNTYLGNTSKIIVSTGAWTHTGTASVSTNLTVSGNASVTGILAASGRATVGTNLTVSGNTSIVNNLTVNGAATLGDATSDLTTISGRATIGTNLYVAGNTILGNPSVVTDRTIINGVTVANGQLNVTGNSAITGTLTVTGTSTFNGTTSSIAAAIKNMKEPATVSATAATGTINYDVTTQSILYYTTNASANWTVNFRASSGTSLNAAMSTGDVITVVFLVTQGSTAYYNSAVQVDGASVTPKWQGGSAPSAGNASSIDIYTYTIVKTGSATFTVFASQTKFA